MTSRVSSGDLEQRLRDGLLPRKPDEHHSRCSSRAGEECDCYAKRSNAAFEALDALLRRLSELEQALILADELADSYGRQYAKDGKFYAYMDARAALSSEGE